MKTLKITNQNVENWQEFGKRDMILKSFFSPRRLVGVGAQKALE